MIDEMQGRKCEGRDSEVRETLRRLRTAILPVVILGLIILCEAVALAVHHG